MSDDPPKCPYCGRETKLVTRRDGGKFYSCVKFPTCRGSISIPGEKKSEATVSPNPVAPQWRREAALKVMLALMAQGDRWDGDKRTLGEIAVQGVDELLDALDK